MSTDAERRLPLSERLRPRRLSEVLGNVQARRDLRAWADRWLGGTPGGHRAALLVGPPGVGKTSAALALAGELGWTVVEMNASEARNQTAIERVAGRASLTRSLAADGGVTGTSRTLILLDEADCLSGRGVESSRALREPPNLRDYLRRRYQTVEALNTAWGLPSGGKSRPFEEWGAVPRTPGNAGWAKLPAARKDIDDWRASAVSGDLSDRGGLAAIAQLVRSTRQPVVLTVNDERPLTRYSTAFRTSVSRIRFSPLRDAEVAGGLEAVVRSEGVALGTGVLDAITRRAHGDFRAALNDLQAVEPLPPGPAQRDALGVRDLASDFATFTREVLTSPRYYRSVEVRDRLDAPPDDLLPWIEENLDRFASDPAHRDAGFAVLAVAEVFLMRARRHRVYGLWSYAGELLSGGAGLAVRDEASAPSSAEALFPRFLMEMGHSRGTRAVRTGLAAKLGRRLHVSKAKATEILLPFLQRIFDGLIHATPRSRAGRLGHDLVRELDLTEEEVVYLIGGRASAGVVAALISREISAGPGAPEAAAEDAAAGSSPDPSARHRVQRSLGDFGPG